MIRAIVLSLCMMACGKSAHENVNAEAFPAGAKLLPRHAGFSGTAPNRPLSIEVSYSGETLGVNGLPFTPVNQGDPYFVDGWDMAIDELLVVIGNVRLNESPLRSSTDWAASGAQVASKAGPFAFDAHIDPGTPGQLTGADGSENAVPAFVWNTRDDGAAFDSNSRYAFSFDTVAARYPAWNVNLSAQGEQDFDTMVARGWDKFLRAHASYKGRGTYGNQGDPNAANAQAHFASLPTEIYFTLGWNDATSHDNCINPPDATSEDGSGALANRGIQPLAESATRAQITQHVDHIFWDKLAQEGAALRFDPLAVYAPPGTSAQQPWSLNDFHAQHLLAVFPDGSKMPDRSPIQFVPGANQAGIDPNEDPQPDPTQVTLSVSQVPALLLADDVVRFMIFAAQSQMHLNANGLCYIRGQNPADPYFSPTPD